MRQQILEQIIQTQRACNHAKELYNEGAGPQDDIHADNCPFWTGVDCKCWAGGA